MALDLSRFSAWSSTPGAAAVRSAVLRESVRLRCRQTAPAVMALLVFAVIFVVLWRETPVIYAAAWLVLILTGLAYRLTLARRFNARIDAMDFDAVVTADDALRWSSIVNQTLVGAGIWIVGAHGSPVVALYVTFAILFYAVGAMVNLSSDYRSFRDSMPLLLAQPTLYWLTEGSDGLRMVATILVPGLLMFLAVRTSSRTFADSVAIRLEKDALLEELKTQHAHTQSALASAEQANHSKAAFMAAASHDLRQPLFAISVLAETMLLHPLPSAARSIAEQQMQAIGILRSLFDNLLDLSKFDAGGVQPEIRATDLSEVLRALDVEYGPLCRSKNLDWKMHLAAASVATDPDLLLRLLGNLLANAVRYTDSGSVSLHAEILDSKVKITVSDTGPGIAAGDQQRIFDEFVQLGNAHRNRQAGVGLGLSIVRRIDDLLGTGLKLQSELGAGTRFSISIPLSEAATVLAPASEAQGDALVLPKTFMVWIVDDDPLVRSALSFQFDTWGCQYRAIASKAELDTLVTAEQRWPDAIILDDMLGNDTRGLDIARWLVGRMSRRQILLVTGSADAARMKQIRDSGFDLMRKPVSARDLKRWLSAAEPETGAIVG